MVQPINIQPGRVMVQADPATTETERSLTAPTPRPSTGETVLLSAGAQAPPPALAAGPPKDSARIDSLRAGIANGSYRPDPDVIADSLTQNIMELSF